MEYEIWRNISTGEMHVVGIQWKNDCATSSVQSAHVVKASQSLTVDQLRAAERGRFTSDATLAAYINGHKAEFVTLPPYEAVMNGVIVI